MLTQKVHLIGICGTGMGSLAGLLAAAGHSVRGSDENVYPPISTMLEDNGIEVMSGYRPSNLEWGPDLVVIGNIVSRGNPEGEEVLRRGRKDAGFSQAVEDLLPHGRPPGAVAGTHR